MKTKVTKTSISTYHETAPQRATLRQLVAEYILNETKHGSTVWIAKIAAKLSLEKSTSSARMNEIKKYGATISGVDYQLSHVRTERPNGEKRKVEQWALVIKQKCNEL
jgi:hypothetical protein